MRFFFQQIDIFPLVLYLSFENHLKPMTSQMIFMDNKFVKKEQ